MPTRRQFLARSGAAVAVLAPQEAYAAKKRKRPRLAKDTLRGGRFAQGVLSGDPDPNAITLLTVSTT